MRLTILAFAVLSMLLFKGQYDETKSSECVSNQKNLWTALVMYASDNHGAYPADLEPLIQGNYLKIIPTCPTGGQYLYAPQPDNFSLVCTRTHRAPRDLYNPQEGLLDHP